MQMLLEERNKYIQSPLNYTGGKFKLLPQILPLLPRNIDIFVDLFCGGGNVGINIQSRKIIFNDINSNLVRLLETFRELGLAAFDLIDEIISEYGLSQSAKYGFEYYNTTGTKGLSVYNRNKYLKLRNDFNRAEIKDNKYYMMLYVLVVYAFNNQIRFNRNGEFNLPPGKRDFNAAIQEKLKRFIECPPWSNYEFSSCDFRHFDTSRLTKNSFVYLDPPYLITSAAYTDKGGWKSQDEKDLLKFLDCLNNKNIRFAMSNVLKCKGKENSILKDWLDRNSDIYNIINLTFNYNHASYQIKDKKSATEEVLIVNYKI